MPSPTGERVRRMNSSARRPLYQTRVFFFFSFFPTHTPCAVQLDNLFSTIRRPLRLLLPSSFFFWVVGGYLPQLSIISPCTESQKKRERYTYTHTTWIFSFVTFRERQSRLTIFSSFSFKKDKRKKKKRIRLDMKKKKFSWLDIKYVKRPWIFIFSCPE